MICAESNRRAPQCALDLLVPDWKICRRPNPLLEKQLQISRVVTYIKGSQNESGHLSWSFGHDKCDHVMLPMRHFDDKLALVNAWCNQECFWDFFRHGTQAFHLDEHSSPLRGSRAQGILPYDHEQPGLAGERACYGSTPIFTQLRHILVHSPLRLLGLNARDIIGRSSQMVDDEPERAGLQALEAHFDAHRAAHLWLSWSLMPNLRNVLLDLRIYSHDVNTERRILSKWRVIQRAEEMARHLRLELLVLAGLQSYSFATRYDGISAEEIEEAPHIGGEPNWIRIFQPALRPGGKLVLVDRVTDEAPI
ncbi:hypothetical protein GGR56DRAFT_615905 [Xylariaceae sp. FL0804]|nr:hypothetical protein GGR56DRAFT_615905 [Xylariaceae sp. FL0804]